MNNVKKTARLVKWGTPKVGHPLSVLCTSWVSSVSVASELFSSPGNSSSSILLLTHSQRLRIHFSDKVKFDFASLATCYIFDVIISCFLFPDILFVCFKYFHMIFCQIQFVVGFIEICAKSY